MKTILLTAMLVASGEVSAAKMPSNEDIDAMYASSDAFVRVCETSIKQMDGGGDFAALAVGCVSFVNGVGQARAIASTYEVLGKPVCAREATGRSVLDAMFELYSSGSYSGISPAALALAAQARVAPCK